MRFCDLLRGKLEITIRSTHLTLHWRYFLLSLRLFPHVPIQSCYATQIFTAENTKLYKLLCQGWSDTQQILITVLLSYADTEFICCKALSEVALCLENVKERNSIELHTGGENAFSYTLGQFFIIVNWEYREMEAANKIQLWVHWHRLKVFHCFDFPPYTYLSNPYNPKAAWSQLKGYVVNKYPSNRCFI